LARGKRPNAQGDDTGASYLQQVTASEIGVILMSDRAVSFNVLIHGDFSE
jgi:hypothetical protein